MNTIHKYSMISDVAIIDMPQGAKILSVGVQRTEIVIWAQVNTDNPTVTHRFIAFNTGEACGAIPEQFIGTVTVGSIVWHVYDEGE